MDIIIIKSKRKTMSMSVNDELNAVVRAPYGVSRKRIESFVKDNEKWLEEAVRRKKKHLERFDITEDEAKRLKAYAKEYIPKRVEELSQLMRLKPTGVKITSAKKRFGSCSSKNSLCFSFYLMQYPEETIDYVIVHEIAHIREHNHSKAFYDIVSQYVPDYKKHDKILKNKD
jgi:hypothetical protein